MVEKIALELMFGIGRFFLNPSLYISLLFVLLVGFRRTKKERKDFTIRIHPFNLEFAEFTLSGCAVGMVASVVILGLGVIIPAGFIMITSLLTILFVLIMKPRWLSSAFVVGLAMLASLVLPKVKVDNTIASNLLSGITNSPLLAMSVLLSVLLFAEGFLIVKKGHLHTSPKLIKSKRGKLVGTHESKKMWMVPVLLLVPGNAITSVFEWWPVIDTPYATFSLLIVPFGIGFHQQVQASLPMESIQETGRRVLLLAIVVSLITVGAYWLPILAIVAAVIAMIGRELITVKQRMNDDNSASFFTNTNKGLVILGVIPNSPAEKMSLQVGEIISKVNGNQVRSEKEFYEALQANRAFCKLDVLDYNGEVRFVQRALYDGEHHELGLLFVHDEKQWTNEAV